MSGLKTVLMTALVLGLLSPGVLAWEPHGQGDQKPPKEEKKVPKEPKEPKKPPKDKP